jgi:hypothetical protein
MINCECCGRFEDERAVEFVLNPNGRDWMICQSCLGDNSDDEIVERMSAREGN